MKKLPAQPVSGLMDGIGILQELTLSFEPLSTNDLSAKTGMEKTRVNRILKTLDFMDLAYRTQDRKYTVGSGIHILAAQSLFASGLIQVAVKHLEPLQNLGLVVALGLLAEDRVCYLYHWQPGISTVEALGRLAMFPVEKSSIGIALLARREPDFQEKVSQKLRLRGGNPDELNHHLEKLHQTGIARVRMEDNTSMAVPLGHPAFAAIALSGKMTAEEEKTRHHQLQETAEAIAAELKVKGIRT